ncbi:MAG: exodeoxyribonuclease I [Methyloprofundus sp.]|nr:exodeoxyribonuclease I [Methyloprofundus sp.]
MVEQSFYWHDYETFGVDPRRDKAVQFAGVRTDFDFNVIGEPLVVYCQLTNDSLPQPEACVVTGITPQLAAEKGVCEAEFIAAIHTEMSKSSTCALGYNNLRFDDEVTRNLLYRNFYDPYAREWQKGNSRWDLIDLVRTMYALRPDGINWPVNEEGRVSLRLDQLTIANGIEHAGAHDALSDVYATIEFAKLIKQTQPKLFQFLLENRGKKAVSQLLQLGSYKPVIHVSGMYGTDKQYLAVVLPLCQHPSNTNGVVVYDLSVPPDELLQLSAEEIHTRLFTATIDLPEGVERIPLKTIHINKCPVVAPLNVLRPEDALRLNIDVQQAVANIELIEKSSSLLTKLKDVFTMTADYAPVTDPDLMIYAGGFFTSRDKAVAEEIRELKLEQLADYVVSADDKRLPEMFFRYKARNYPETLSAAETIKWLDFCCSRLSGEGATSFLGFIEYEEKLAELKQNEGVDIGVINALKDYAKELKMKLKIG